MRAALLLLDLIQPCPICGTGITPWRTSHTVSSSLCFFVLLLSANEDVKRQLVQSQVAKFQLNSYWKPQQIGGNSCKMQACNLADVSCSLVQVPTVTECFKP